MHLTGFKAPKEFQHCSCACMVEAVNDTKKASFLRNENMVLFQYLLHFQNVEKLHAPSFQSVQLFFSVFLAHGDSW